MSDKFEIWRKGLDMSDAKESDAKELGTNYGVTKKTVYEVAGESFDTEDEALKHLHVSRIQEYLSNALCDRSGYYDSPADEDITDFIEGLIDLMPK